MSDTQKRTETPPAILKVEYIPLPPEKEMAWEAGVELLLQILKGEDSMLPVEEEVLSNTSEDESASQLPTE